MTAWKQELTSGAIANNNIRFWTDDVDLSEYSGGTNEDSAPTKRLTIRFVGCPCQQMWIYGDKKLLTGNGRTEQVRSFFEANGIKSGDPAEIEIILINDGEFLVRKV